MKAATEFFGIGSKPAVIKVRKIEPVSEEEEMKEIVETVKLDSSKRSPVQEEKKTEAIKPVKKEIKEPKAVSEKPRQPKPVKERAAKENSRENSESQKRNKSEKRRLNR